MERDLPVFGVRLRGPVKKTGRKPSFRPNIRTIVTPNVFQCLAFNVPQFVGFAPGAVTQNNELHPGAVFHIFRDGSAAAPHKIRSMGADHQQACVLIDHP
jgi:hypothetical protein